MEKLFRRIVEIDVHSIDIQLTKKSMLLCVLKIELIVHLSDKLGTHNAYTWVISPV